MALPPHHNEMKAARPPDKRPPHRRELLHVCGLAAVRALFARDPGRVARLFFEPRLAAELAPLCHVLAAARKPYRAVAAAELARIAGTVLHGGVVAVARPLPPLAARPEAIAGWAADGKPLVVLDGIGNPHNLGAIARSAAFFAVPRLLLAARREQALPSDASYRVAAGGLDQVALYRAPLPALLPALRRVYRVIGAAAEGGVPPARRHDGRPVALVLGNEERGLDPATRALCEEIVTIPGGGAVQSLNVAAAAAILIYLLTCR
ncbi:MAG TPA: RNA methyltransferase [Stellaceae bacterium]|nr:RNA methyltransferase [Stellaceae bacterium]